jgi:hypothetical protein
MTRPFGIADSNYRAVVFGHVRARGAESRGVV